MPSVGKGMLFFVVVVASLALQWFYCFLIVLKCDMSQGMFDHEIMSDFLKSKSDGACNLLNMVFL